MAKKEEVKTVKVQFKSSPTGAFKLAYNVGEIADIEESKAKELIELGFCESLEKEAE